MPATSGATGWNIQVRARLRARLDPRLMDDLRSLLGGAPGPRRAAHPLTEYLPDAFARPLRFVVCLGGMQPPALTASGQLPAPTFISSGGASFAFPLSRPNAPAGSCFDCVSHLPSTANTWMPPALSVGALLSGLKARGGAAAAGGDGSGAGDAAYAILLMDAASHTHQIGAHLTPGGWVRGAFKPFGLRLSPGPMRAAA